MQACVLTICIPTYNRKDILLNDIRDYLSVDDDRFSIRVNDNCSSDGTLAALEEIKDPRLIVTHNQENLGPVPNSLIAKSGNKSEYIMEMLDKDHFNVQHLKRFLDFLETEHPFFGFVDLDISKPFGFVFTEAGYNNVLKTAYRDKHPSGHFYRTDLFEIVLQSEPFRKLDSNFDFPHEIINAELAVAYPSVVVEGPYVINANYRKELHGSKTKSYDETNIWFGAERRLVEYKYYIDNALSLDLSKKEIQKLAAIVTLRAAMQVSTQLKSLFKDESVCEHYCLQMRDVRIKEMSSNIQSIFAVFENEAKGRLSFAMILMIKCWTLFRLSLHYLRGKFRKQ